MASNYLLAGMILEVGGHHIRGGWWGGGHHIGGGWGGGVGNRRPGSYIVCKDIYVFQLGRCFSLANLPKDPSEKIGI